ncbi:cold shock domain-containing protein [Planococcus sp. 1R117A]|uniref:cold shock domain-containing protein n=1 Tax=Planococcus sp. 1R117A TaxID=3447020 RepID=UPI003EDC46CC
MSNFGGEGDLTGIVVSFDKEKGFGYIRGDNGEMFYTHTEHSNIDEFPMLNEGQQVKFIPIQGTPEKERIATNVTLIF